MVGLASTELYGSNDSKDAKDKRGNRYFVSTSLVFHA
jgi:hypothetical protein